MNNSISFSNIKKDFELEKIFEFNGIENKSDSKCNIILSDEFSDCHIWIKDYINKECISDAIDKIKSKNILKKVIIRDVKNKDICNHIVLDSFETISFQQKKDMYLHLVDVIQSDF